MTKHLPSAEARQAEIAKYERAYAAGNYRMGASRMADAVRTLRHLPLRSSYLDVSCGRGEMLRHAERFGFQTVRGTEIVSGLVDGEKVVRAECHALPFDDRSFDVVSMFDVIEHLLPGDDEEACRELRRVARRHVLITANNRESFNHEGEDLHINKRPYVEWEARFAKWFGVQPRRIPVTYHSQMWRIDLG